MAEITLTPTNGRPIVDYSLYYVTGRQLTNEPLNLNSFYKNLELSILGGVTIIQLREKEISTKLFLELAKGVKLICDKYKVPLLINDRLDIALAIESGLHIGQSDLPPLLARQLLGPNKILGLSINTLTELELAIELGNQGIIDYIGLGPLFETVSKKDCEPTLGVRGVRDFLNLLGVRGSQLFTVGIGGINSQTLPNILSQTPSFIPSNPTTKTPSYYKTLSGIAVISALALSPDPTLSAQNLLASFKSGTKKGGGDSNWRMVGEEEEGAEDPFGGRLKGLGRGSKEEEKEILKLIGEALSALKERGEKGEGGVVHHITNDVVKNDTANLTLSLSTSPIMSSSPQEAVELSSLLSSLLINLGTLSSTQIETMLLAGKAAIKGGKRVIFDPVGLGASGFRKEMGGRLMGEVHFSVVKGNGGEISTLYGSNEVKARGVDSVGSGFKDPIDVVRKLALREKMVIALSGPSDYISDGKNSFKLSNGDKFQGLITGSGCMSTAAIASFLTLPISPLLATLSGLTVINLAAQRAAKREGVYGPNTFRAALIDEVWRMDSKGVEEGGRVERG